MSNQERLREILKRYNQDKVIRYKNRAYIQTDVMLLKDYIKQEIRRIEYKFRNSKYKVDLSDIDKITNVIFKPISEQERIEREQSDIFESDTSVAELPSDLVVDIKSKFAYSYNYNHGISNKYFLLDSYGINSKKDVQDNKYARPIPYRKLKTVYRVTTVYDKVKVTLYYLNGKQISKQKAFKYIKYLKNNVEEVIYRYKGKYYRFYINTINDKIIPKNKAFRLILALKKGVKRKTSYRLGKKRLITVKKRVIARVEYKKVNFFATTYKNYLPYFLFMRLVKKEVRANRKLKIKKHIEDRVKFYISAYYEKNGKPKYISSLVKNGHDIIANSDMIGNVIMPQLVKSDLIQSMIKDDNRVRIKQHSDSAYIDTPISLLFFVGQESFQRLTKRSAIKDIDIIDVKDENDTGQMKDQSSLDINENKDFLEDIKDTNILKNENSKLNINDLLSKSKEFALVLKQIESIKQKLEFEKRIVSYLNQRNVKKLTINNILKVLSYLNNSINRINERIKYGVSPSVERKMKDERDFYEYLRFEILDIERQSRKIKQDNMFKKFNSKKDNIILLQEKLIELENRKERIISKNRKKIEQNEQSIIEYKQDIQNGKVNLLKQYYNNIVNAINKNNRMIIFKNKE